MATMAIANKPLFDGSEWNFDLIGRTYEAIEEIGVGTGPRHL